MIQVRDTAGSKNKLRWKSAGRSARAAADHHPGPPRGRPGPPRADRHLQASGRPAGRGARPGDPASRWRTSARSVASTDGRTSTPSSWPAASSRRRRRSRTSPGACSAPIHERLLLTGNYVPQMRGHLMKDGSRTAVTVQVHPDPRVQALVEQVREREIEQMVGRLRLVHRTQPARVLLLTNTPTALAVDQLTTWEGIMPDKMEQAIVRGRGVLPLSSAELARVHPELWATAEEADIWWRRKGSQVPIRVLLLEGDCPFRRHPSELPAAGANGAAARTRPSFPVRCTARAKRRWTWRRCWASSRTCASLRCCRGRSIGLHWPLLDRGCHRPNSTIR